MVSIRSERSEIEGPVVSFTCPRCQVAVEAGTVEVTERNSLMGLIPLFSCVFTRLTCCGCGKTSTVSWDPEAVGQATPEELTAAVGAAVPGLARICIIIAFVTFWLPVVGPLLALIGLALTWKTRSHWKTAAILALVIGLVMTGVFISYMG